MAARDPRKVPVVHVETLQPPNVYSDQQREDMCWIAYMLARGRFVYALPPDKP